MKKLFFQDERNKVQIADLKNEVAKRDGESNHNTFYRGTKWLVIFYTETPLDWSSEVKPLDNGLLKNSYSIITSFLFLLDTIYHFFYDFLINR